jgi:predicted  nucleic acid-binding Zn-ribbon protein
MNKTRIENRIDAIETELYSLDIKIDQAFTHKEVKELSKKYQKLTKSRDKLQKKLTND